MSQEPHHVRSAAPRVIAWETTRRCPMACRHCRGGARDVAYEDELSTLEAHRLIDGLTAFGRPVLILSGGEPMARPDYLELARHASDAGLRVAMAPCGAFLDRDAAASLLQAGVQRISLSIDGAAAESHDTFRGVPGAFAMVMQALAHAREVGLAFQINTTVSRLNVAELPAILRLAEEAGAAALDLFFLVPTGRGAALKDLVLSPEHHEQTLQWIVEMRGRSSCSMRVTCAPHMVRIERQRGVAAAPGSAAPSGGGRPQGASGCMAGRGFLFISHRGILQPCGFLDVPCGDVRQVDFDLAGLCARSTVLATLADSGGLQGSCGRCEFRRACGGCRARAYAQSGNLLGEDPACAYVPGSLGGE